MRQLFLLLHPLISTLKIAGKTLLYRRLFASRLPRLRTYVSNEILAAVVGSLLHVDTNCRHATGRRSFAKPLWQSALFQIAVENRWCLLLNLHWILSPGACVPRQWDHHSLSRRLVISLSCILIHEFHKKPTVDHPRKNESRSIDFFRGCSVRDYRRL